MREIAGLITVFIRMLHLAVTQQQRQGGPEDGLNCPCHCYLNDIFFGVDNLATFSVGWIILPYLNLNYLSLLLLFCPENTSLSCVICGTQDSSFWLTC